MTEPVAARRCRLREAVEIAANSLHDVVAVGQFSPAVDPARWCDALEQHLRTALRACADDLETAPSPPKVHEDDEVTRGGTMEIPEGRRTASQHEVVSAPAPNKDIGGYLGAMADGECYGPDPEHECHEVLSIEHWCKSCLAVEIIAWHHADVERYLTLKAAALDAAPSKDKVQPTGKRWTDVLCTKCGGNGVIKIPGGISQCPRCDGRCYEPDAPATDTLPPGVSYMICALCSHTKWSDRECLSCFGLGPVNAEQTNARSEMDRARAMDDDAGRKTGPLEIRASDDAVDLSGTPTERPWSATFNAKFGAAIWWHGRPMFRVMAGIEDSRTTDDDPVPQWQKCIDAVLSLNERPAIELPPDRVRCPDVIAWLLTDLRSRRDAMWSTTRSPATEEERMAFVRAGEIDTIIAFIPLLAAQVQPDVDARETEMNYRLFEVNQQLDKAAAEVARLIRDVATRDEVMEDLRADFYGQVDRIVALTHDLDVERALNGHTALSETIADLEHQLEDRTRDRLSPIVPTTPENVVMILAQRFGRGDPGSGLSMDAHEAHMLMAYLQKTPPASAAPPQAP